MNLIWHNYRILHPSEEFLLNLTNTILSKFSRILSVLPLLISWILGLIVLNTAGLLFTLIFYLPLLIARWQISSHVNLLIKNINTLNEADAVEFHLEMENLGKRLLETIVKGGHFFVFTPVIHELRKVAEQVKTAEQVLFQKAYPEYDSSLTKDQLDELYKVMASWREDEKSNLERY
ncbi:MAG: hypothetical protein N2044_03670 [Cyclobacteriaceae bacterium]|nr:hypothetical protein [Cyclobacteriaceae bacterium]MCX7636926.1 hypothetical protein [Cyclobacteriaceae bacterium]MDW8330377.1 hypothetical protein [Cyclobacteriaceae bacterium]